MSPWINAWKAKPSTLPAPPVACANCRRCARKPRPSRYHERLLRPLPSTAPCMNTLAQLKAGQLAGATRLDLACGLTEFPREIFELADSLEILNLTGNALSSLPDDLHRLTHLRVLFCSDNAFTELPQCLGQCAKLSMIGFKANQISQVAAAALPPQLRWLILTDNCIRQLPDELGQRPLLQKLMLAGNQLTDLPPSLAQALRQFGKGVVRTEQHTQVRQA
ncbi:hypothetical protein ALP29_04744, partial [Pseudomonas syringae pv. avii]